MSSSSMNRTFGFSAPRGHSCCRTQEHKRYCEDQLFHQGVPYIVGHFVRPIEIQALKPPNNIGVFVRSFAAILYEIEQACALEVLPTIHDFDVGTRLCLPPCSNFQSPPNGVALVEPPKQTRRIGCQSAVEPLGRAMPIACNTVGTTSSVDNPIPCFASIDVQREDEGNRMPPSQSVNCFRRVDGSTPHLWEARHCRKRTRLGYCCQLQLVQRVEYPADVVEAPGSPRISSGDLPSVIY